MTHEQIVQEIRDIEKGSHASKEVSKILYAKKCYYLLTLYPNEFKSRIEQMYAINKIAIKERYSSLKLFFSSAPIPYAIIKGAVLSKSLYNNPFWRVSGDIDFLIRIEDSYKIKKILYDLGFVQGYIRGDEVVPFSREQVIYQSTVSHQISPFVKKTGSKILPFVSVDINVDIFWGEKKESANMNYILSKARKEKICDITVNKLLPELEFIALCLHHYKDLNSLYLLFKNGFPLQHFCDIYYYLKNNELDTSVLHYLIESMNVRENILFCIYYANQIFNSAVLSQYLESLNYKKDEFLFNTYGLTFDEKRYWENSFYERLFLCNMQEYLRNRMSSKDWDKIQANYRFM